MIQQVFPGFRASWKAFWKMWLRRIQFERQRLTNAKYSIIVGQAFQ